MCRVKGKSADQCQNYIRVLKLQRPESLIVCGTNAYRPRCRTYLITVSFSNERAKSADGRQNNGRPSANTISHYRPGKISISHWILGERPAR